MTLRGHFALLALIPALAISGCTRTSHGEGKPEPLITPTPAERIHELINQARLSSAHWGILIEATDGRTLYDHNGSRGFVPASTLKIITTAAALDILGPDHTFQTTLEAVGTINESGTLHGDLLLTGSGDPSPGSWHLDGENTVEAVLHVWLEAIKQAGITTIEGNILGDGRFFTPEHHNPAWPHGYLANWYATGTSGLAFGENAWRGTVYPGENIGVPPQLDIHPSPEYFTIINDATTGEPGTPNNVYLSVHKSGNNILHFSGTISIDHGEIKRRGSVWGGNRYGPWLLRKHLIEAGIQVSGEAKDIRQLADPGLIDNARERRLIHVHTSPPLSRLVDVINGTSHNFFAEQLLRYLGALERGEGSYEAGCKVLLDWMESIGAPSVGSLHLVDGSGLAPHNIVQPRHLNHVLKWAASSPDTAAKAAFRDSLSTAPGEGHLVRRLTHAPGHANIQAKTGYTQFSRTISGYTTNSDGDRIVFSIFCNNHSTDNRVVDEVADAIIVLTSRVGTMDYTSP